MNLKNRLPTNTILLRKNYQAMAIPAFNTISFVRATFASLEKLLAGKQRELIFCYARLRHEDYGENEIM